MRSSKLPPSGKPHSYSQKVFAFIVVESFYTTLLYPKGISP
jgi:hypothetical protein